MTTACPGRSLFIVRDICGPVFSSSWGFHSRTFAKQFLRLFCRFRAKGKTAVCRLSMAMKVEKSNPKAFVVLLKLQSREIVQMRWLMGIILSIFSGRNASALTYEMKGPSCGCSKELVVEINKQRQQLQLSICQVQSRRRISWPPGETSTESHSSSVTVWPQGKGRWWFAE